VRPAILERLQVLVSACRVSRCLNSWLCHSDARQVYDLPETAPIFSQGSATRGHRPVTVQRLFGKSETCRASKWQSQRSN